MVATPALIYRTFGIVVATGEEDMKTCIVITLFLSMGFALAAFAQQPAASTDQGASASQTAAAADKEPLQSIPRQDFWDGDEPSFGALLLHPFATKEYVRRHVQPVRDRVSELEELTASHGKMIRDVDARAQQGIQLASAKSDLAATHAEDASGKAQMAKQTATIADTRISTVETMVGNLDQYKPGAQTEIRFRPGQTVLSKQAKDALDEMAAPLKNQHGFIIEVQGFASGQGQTAIANSRMMADSVVRYLVLNHEIPAYRIYVIGMGNAPVTQHAAGTRVEVSVLKNELDQTAKQ